MRISRFGQKLASTSGIGRLMDDLGIALVKGKDILMLGGGNPAHIPQVQKYFRKSIEQILNHSDEFEKAVGNYDPPVGNRDFIEAVVGLLKNELGWKVRPENVALTNGSQTAFFILFNMFAGDFGEGVCKKVLFPLTPEYIGYCDVGLVDNFFTANKPLIERVDEHIFKYHIDFDRLDITGDIGAVCVSRPTNPTGNCLTDTEIEKLSELARAGDIPLIIDNAYGAPFPDIIFSENRPIWNRQMIFCMSLSKLGLPAARTGIIIADEEVIEMISHVNAVMSLAPAGLGPALMLDLVRTGKIIDISRNIIKPFYRQKAQFVLEQVLTEFKGLDFHIHKPEGAFFLWLWFPGLPISNEELYQRLKKKGVLVIPGHYFFPGLKEDWPHKNECIRVNYSQDQETVAAGIKLIAEEVKRACNIT